MLKLNSILFPALWVKTKLTNRTSQSWPRSFSNYYCIICAQQNGPAFLITEQNATVPKPAWSKEDLCLLLIQLHPPCGTQSDLTNIHITSEDSALQILHIAKNLDEIVGKGKNLRYSTVNVIAHISSTDCN